MHGVSKGREAWTLHEHNSDVTDRVASDSGVGSVSPKVGKRGIIAVINSGTPTKCNYSS